MASLPGIDDLPGGAPAEGPCKAIRVFFPGGAPIAVAGRGVADELLAEVAADLARFLLSSPPPAAKVRGGIELGEAGSDDLVHAAQPEAGEGVGK